MPLSSSSTTVASLAWPGSSSVAPQASRESWRALPVAGRGPLLYPADLGGPADDGSEPNGIRPLPLDGSAGALADLATPATGDRGRSSTGSSRSTCGARTWPPRRRPGSRHSDECAGLARARVDRPRDAGGARGGALRARRLSRRRPGGRARRPAAARLRRRRRPRPDPRLRGHRRQRRRRGPDDHRDRAGGAGPRAGAPAPRRAVRRAERSGAEALLLEVRADNEAAKRLYSTSGFEVITVRRRYYQPGDIDALVRASTSRYPWLTNRSSSGSRPRATRPESGSCAARRPSSTP